MANLDPAAVIDDAARIVELFGYWPSLHDFEVVRLVFDRYAPQAGPGPAITALIHMWRVADVRPNGSFRYDTHRLVGLQFGSVVTYEATWFNHQNVIDDIVIAVADDPSGDRLLRAELPSLHGLALVVTCRRIAIVSIEDYLPDDSVYDRR